MAKMSYRPPSGGKAAPPAPSTGAIKVGATIPGTAHKSSLPPPTIARLSKGC